MQTLSIVVFVIAGATIFYVLFGYPLLLNWVARRANNPVHKDDKLRTVSFVIAVYNGEKFLERKLKTILALNYPRELMDILIVSDGSTDRTDEIAHSFGSLFPSRATRRQGSGSERRGSLRVGRDPGAMRCAPDPRSRLPAQRSRMLRRPQSRLRQPQNHHRPG
jgi:cellulose synthase/poly-beta-1,6-N-acetylglucosamine synthase-like glycosyltransferase